MRRTLSPALAAVSVVLLVAVLTGSGPAAPPGGDAALTTVQFSPADRRDTLAYWTVGRMREVGAEATLGHDAPAIRPWDGPAVKTVGRLFFTNEKGQDSYCTATAVRSGNRSTAMTAGHCVQLPASPDNHYSNMVFVPGYDEGRRPHGVFAVRAVVMPRSWQYDAKTDVAAVVLDPHDGTSLTDAVGGQKLAVDRKPGGEVTVFGYPDSQEQRGERLMYCAGHPSPTPEGVQSVPCPMEGGSSGGPWLAAFDAKSGLGDLVSVNSFGDAAEGGSAIQGEVLGPVARELHARAADL